MGELRGPRLRDLNPGIAIATRTLKTFGITEGGLDEMLSTLFESENPSLGIYSKRDGIHLRAIARASSDDEARRLIEPMEAEIRRIAGHAIWGEDDDTAVAAALSALSERGLTLGIVEGFTGGLLTGALMESPQAADVVSGGVALGDGGGSVLSKDLPAELPSPASSDAAALADAARNFFKADVGLAITPLVSVATSDSGPIGTAHVAISARDGATHTSSALYPTRRLRIRERAVTHTLLELARALRTGAAGQDSDWG